MSDVIKSLVAYMFLNLFYFGYAYFVLIPV